MKLNDQVAVVTGGTRGIGRSIVEILAREGATVLFTYLSSDSNAKEIEAQFNKKKSIVRGFKVDVRDLSQVEIWKQNILEEFGKIDILVNNAGITKDKALAMMSRQDWDEVIDANLNSLFNVTKSFIISFMKQRKGNIINISSLSGIIGIPRQTNYSASKGGMISFSRALSKEVAPHNIRVNVVAPGFIDTDMTKNLKPEYVAEMIKLIPLARFGRAEEVAKAVLFLASAESNYITGQVFRVDGGLGIN